MKHHVSLHYYFLFSMEKKTVLLLIFFLMAKSMFAIDFQGEIDSLENKLKNADAKEKTILFNKIAGFYLKGSDTVQAYNYFKKSIHISEKRNFAVEEYHLFQYVIGPFNSNGDYKSSIVFLRKILHYVQNKNMQKGVGFAYSFLGRQYLLMDNYDSSEKYQQLALDKFNELNCTYGKAIALDRYGYIFMIQSQYLKALKYYYKAIHINRKLKVQHDIGVSLYHIGLTKLYLSDYEDAVSYILKSLKIWDLLNDVANKWNCNELIGNIYIKMGNYNTALYYHRIALDIRQKCLEPALQSGNKVAPVYMLGIAYSYNNIGEVYLNLKQYDSAYYYALKSLKIKKTCSVASKDDLANSLLNLGNIYCALNKPDSAFLLINKALKLFKETHNRSSYAEALYGLGKLNGKLNNFSLSKNNYLEALKIAKEVGVQSDVIEGYKNLSELYLKKKDYKHAYQYHMLYTQSKDSLLSTKNKNKIAELQISYKVDKKEQEIKHQHQIIKQKQHQIILTNFIGLLVFILAVSFIVFLIVSKKQKEKILEKEKENLQKELDLKNRDLVCNVSKIYTKNQMINNVAHTLTKNTIHFKQSNIGIIKDIIGELQHNIDETSWTDFETRFAKVHKGFYDKLDAQYSHLTKSERKLCAMLKLGLSSKEIAAITLVRPESVDTARSRLRKKLGLSADESLFKFLKNY